MLGFQPRVVASTAALPSAWGCGFGTRSAGAELQGARAGFQESSRKFPQPHLACDSTLGPEVGTKGGRGFGGQLEDAGSSKWTSGEKASTCRRQETPLR